MSGRPCKLNDEISERNMLNVIIKAAEHDDDAKAWLKGEGCIEVKNNSARFVRFTNQTGRIDRKAIRWAAEIIRKSDYKCQECGAGGYLHAHHIIPWCESLDARYDIMNGIALCPLCHSQRHPRLKSLILSSKAGRGKYERI